MESLAAIQSQDSFENRYYHFDNSHFFWLIYYHLVMQPRIELILQACLQLHFAIHLQHCVTLDG